MITLISNNHGNNHDKNTNIIIINQTNDCNIDHNSKTTVKLLRLFVIIVIILIMSQAGPSGFR